MANRLQIRRGTESQRQDTNNTYLVGEPLFDETRGALYVGTDGTNAQADPVANGLNYILNTWDATITYPVNHVIKYEGVVYRALQDTTGNIPGAATSNPFWERISFSRQEIVGIQAQDDPTLVHINIDHGDFGVAHALDDNIRIHTSNAPDGSNVFTNYAFVFDAVSNVASIAVDRMVGGGVSATDFPVGTLVSLTQGNSTAATSAISDTDSNGELWVVTNSADEGAGNQSFIRLSAAPWPLARSFATAADTELVVPTAASGLFVRQASDTDTAGNLRIFTPFVDSGNVFYDSTASGVAGHPVLTTVKPAYTQDSLPSNPAAGDSLILNRPFLSQVQGITDAPVGGRFKLAPVPLTRGNSTSGELFNSGLQFMRYDEGGTTVVGSSVTGDSYVGLYNVHGTQNIFGSEVTSLTSFRSLRAAAKPGDIMYFGPRRNDLGTVRDLEPSHLGIVTSTKRVADTNDSFPLNVMSFEQMNTIGGVISMEEFNPFNLDALSRVGETETTFDTYGPATRHANRVTANVLNNNDVRVTIPPQGAAAPNNPQSANGLVGEIIADFATLRTSSFRPRWIGFYNGNNLEFSVYSRDNEALDVTAGTAGNEFIVSYASSSTKTISWSRTSRTSPISADIDNIRVAGGSTGRLALPSVDGHADDYNFLPFILFSSAGNRYNLTETGVKWFYDCHISLDEGLATFDGINWRQ